MSAQMATLAGVMASRYPDSYAANRRTVAALVASGQRNLPIVVSLSGASGSSVARMTSSQQKVMSELTSRATRMGVFGSIHNASQTPGYGTHAETKVLGFSDRRGFDPIAMGTSRPICAACAGAVQSRGGMIVGPRVAIWPY